MKNSTSVKESLTRTNDARFAARYIVGDAANSSGPETSLTDTTSCPDRSPPVAGSPTPVVRFTWSSTSSAGTTPGEHRQLRARVEHAHAPVLPERHVGERRRARFEHRERRRRLRTERRLQRRADDDHRGHHGDAWVRTAARAYQYASPARSGRRRPWAGRPRSSIRADRRAPTRSSRSASRAPTGFTAVSVSGSGEDPHVQRDTYLNTADSGACEAMIRGYRVGQGVESTKILTGGSCSDGGRVICPTYRRTPRAVHPFAGLPAPSTSGLPSQSGAARAEPPTRCVRETLLFHLGQLRTLQPRERRVHPADGLTTAGSAVLTNDAAGVLIYITGGTLSLGGSSSVRLSSMTAGPYPGLPSGRPPATRPR